MAGTFKWYGNALLKALTGQIDFDTDTFKAMVCTSAYVPDQDAHVFRSSVTNEIAASGTYAAGGFTLGVATVSYDSASNECRVTWADPAAATGVTATGRVVVIYKSRGGAASADELVGYMVESADVTATNGPLAIDLPSPTLRVTAA